MRCRCGWGGEGIIKERRVVSGGSVGRWECCRLCVYQDILIGGLLWVEIGVDNVIYTLTVCYILLIIIAMINKVNIKLSKFLLNDYTLTY